MEAGTTTAAGSVVRQFYGLLSEGKTEESVALLHDDVVVKESTDLPYGGEFHGKDGFMQLAAAMWGMVEPQNITEIEYTDAGEDKCILRMRARFTERESGRSGETDIVEFVTVRDGKIIESDVYYRTPSTVTAAIKGA